MLSSIGRVTLRRVVVGNHSSTNKALTNTSWRVHGSSNVETSFGRLALSLRRLYATATKPTKVKVVKKTTATTPTPKPKSKLKKAPKKVIKATTIGKKKKVAKKVVKKAAPKKKVVVKKTPEQLERIKIKELKAIALSPPKNKPQTAWTEFTQRKIQGGENIGAFSEKNGMEFRALSAQELEELNHVVAQNKVQNNIAYKEFIQSHTPEQIRLANNARRALKRLPGRHNYPSLIDDRLPKAIRNAYVFFMKERWASGDFNHVKAKEALSLIAKEYHQLPEATRTIYKELAAADALRYTQEYKTVFNRDPQHVIIAARKA